VDAQRDLNGRGMRVSPPPPIRYVEARYAPKNYLPECFKDGKTRGERMTSEVTLGMIER
jgi:hypothetical protein